MNAQYYWMNCGYCGINVGMRPSGSLKFYVTSCSFMFCHGCARQCRQPACFSCHTNCKVVPVSNQMPTNVKNLMKNPSEDVANLKQAIAFHLNQYDRVIARLGNLINQHQLELAQTRQKARDSVLRLKELNSKIPEAQQMIDKLQKTVKMLTTDNRHTNDRHNRSGDFFAPGRSGGGLNGGMGTFMAGQNGGAGGIFGGTESSINQNGGMRGFMAAQHGGFGTFMGVQSNSMGVSMVGQSGRMLNNMAVQRNSGGQRSNSGQKPANPSLFNP